MDRPSRFTWRSVAVAAALALVGVLAGAALRGTTDRPEPSAPRVVSVDRAAAGGGEAPSTNEGEREAPGGLTVGFPHDKPGAVAAAVSYAAAPQTWLYLPDSEVRASAEAVTVPGPPGAELVDRLVDDARLLRAELEKANGTVWFVVSPLATKVELYSDTRATVRVWLVRVLSADGIAVPQSGWQTLSFRLAWHEGDWRMVEVTEADGPTPQLEAGLQPWSSRYLDEQLAGFSRVGVG